jgi:dTMP kinase
MTLAAGAPRGAFVVVEGIEGSGKSTLVARLAARLTSQGLQVTTVRDPGGTPLGDEIRGLLLTSSHLPAPATEALLFIASRAELVARQIAPALERGVIVLVDRFLLSTLAYQVAGRGLNADAVLAANQLAVGALIPDLTLVLDLPFESGLDRARARGALDRIEREGEAFHRRVAGLFTTALSSDWQAAHPMCGTIVRVDATGSIEAMENDAWQQLQSHEVISSHSVVS